MPPLSPRKRPSRNAFLRTIALIAVSIHVPFALSAAAPFAWLGLPWPLAWGALVAAGLALLAFVRLPPLISDRRRNGFEALWEQPYLVHLTGALGAAVPIVFASTIAFFVARPHVFDAALAAYLPFALLTGYGTFVLRHWFRMRRLDVVIDGLSPAFDGFRIAHVSDIHVGGLLPEWIVARWVAAVEREAVDVVAVTGDLLTSGTSFHDDAARVVASFPARLGVFLSFGNHDYFDNKDLADRLRARGVRVLKNAHEIIEHDGARLRIAGVDDSWTGNADLSATLTGGEGVPTVLLAHDPDLFDDAADGGAHLVLSGHTHAGQIAVPFFAREMSLANLAHTYRWGRYERGASTMYVSAGLGTTGLPLRIGAAPEIAIVTLRARR